MYGAAMTDKDETREDATDENSSGRAEGETSESSGAGTTSKSSAASSGEARKSSRAPTGRSGEKSRKQAGDSPRGTGRAGSSVAGPVALAAGLALAVGAAAGWFAHDAHAKSQLRKEANAAGEGGSCGAWEQAICSKLGQESAACQQVKAATNLLTTSACDVALQSVPATVSRVKAARASCDELQTRLCKDLSKASPACRLVESQTPSFPPEKCKGMLDQYDKVLEELKRVEQQMQQRGLGVPGMGGPGMGGPGMGSPRGPGSPPGAMPPAHGAAPQGATPNPAPPKAAPHGQQ